MEISAIALEGLEKAGASLDRTAKRIAAAVDPEDSVDLSAEAVALMQARNDYLINLKTAKTGDEMGRALLDILA